MIKTIASSFILGLSFGWGPCLASCGPLLLTYIAGTQKNVFKGLSAYLLFSFSRMFVYLVLGLAVFYSGKVMLTKFFNFFPLILAGSGAFVIFLGILIALGKNINLIPCAFLHKHIIESDKKSMVTLGLVMGLLPCAPLVTMLTYAGLISRHAGENLLYTLAFGLGTAASPLLILAGLAGFIPRIISGASKTGAFTALRVFSIICGLIMIILGIQLIGKAF